MRVKLHPHVRVELRDARNWYFERSPLSAIAFAQTVENALSRIKEAPNTFPFNIFYLIRVTQIVTLLWPIRSEDQVIGPIESYLDAAPPNTFRRLA